MFPHSIVSLYLVFNLGMERAGYIPHVPHPVSYKVGTTCTYAAGTFIPSSNSSMDKVKLDIKIIFLFSTTYLIEIGIDFFILKDGFYDSKFNFLFFFIICY